MSSIFDTDILSEENDKLRLLSLQDLDKENPIEYILSDNSIQLNKPFKIKYITEHNKENCGILYSNNKWLYLALVCVIGKYTNNAEWAMNYNYIKKDINTISSLLPDLNNDKSKSYIIPLETLLGDNTFPVNAFINSLKIKNINKYVAYFLYNAAICVILNVENTITNTYIFYTGLPLIPHRISKDKVDIKSVNINLKLAYYTGYDNKRKPPYYQQHILIPYNNDKK